MTSINETLELLAMNWYEDLGYSKVFSPDIAPDSNSAERKDYSEVILIDRVRSAIERINKCDCRSP